MSGDGGRTGGAGGSGGPVRGLAHVAIATRDADALADAFAPLGAVRGEDVVIDGGTLRLVFLQIGPLTLELLEPRSDAHTVARFIASRGEGLHHVALDVDDLDTMLARCRAAGVRLIDETPRAGGHGAPIAFLHPKSFGGVLIELCQSAKRKPSGA
ncbi:MAG: methylmalonyl-CoA epimerase [Candidatus Eisenbacteria bacterium]|uniref:Methylmalonyl-CoA epimerase n=1 Tax=Eiseniibacteriota bacterium TaxID=2212470 RepID=A0A9D6QIU0_UNCEI|nr:methylmalonyl-CoA epimerase [Candidatus Eisenbacteria bacterium]MBI3539797.1 methylmalonyl-CoA epimerase [Candidatus Eisenbacteria bacterium]